MLRRMMFFVFIIALLCCVTGCKSNTDTVIGFWKSSGHDALTSKTIVVVFEKDKVNYDGTYISSVTYKEDGDVVRAFLDQTIWDISVIDDNTIMVNNKNVVSFKLIRTTPEDAQAINAKSNAPEPKRENKTWKAF